MRTEDHRPRTWASLRDELTDRAQNGRHHGVPGVSAAVVKDYAQKIRDVLAEGDARSCVAQLADHPTRDVREVAALILADETPDADSVDLWKKLACDDDWEVREFAVGPLAVWAAHDIDGGTARLRDLLRSKVARERRAALLAVRQLVVQARWSVGRALPLTGLLWDDDDPYIVENFGSYVVGDGLLRRDPTVVIPWLLASLSPADTPVRAGHVARLLRSQAAAGHREALLPVVRAACRLARPRVAQSLERWIRQGEAAPPSGPTDTQRDA